MRPLRYSVNVTLDGCCDHRAMLADEDLHRHAGENLAQADALLFGRVTYEMMEAAFRPPARTGARPDLPKVVTLILRFISNNGCQRSRPGPSRRAREARSVTVSAPPDGEPRTRTPSRAQSRALWLSRLMLDGTRAGSRQTPYETLD